MSTVTAADATEKYLLVDAMDATEESADCDSVPVWPEKCGQFVHLRDTM